MIETDHRPETDKVLWAFFIVDPNRGPVYGAPQTCNPQTAERCLGEIASRGNFALPHWTKLTWDGTWFDISLLPPGECAPSATYFDAFGPVPHPASGNLIAVLLRKR